VVRSRTSSFAFKDRPRNLEEVAQTLGANLFVDGTVERHGRKLRVSAQLVSPDGRVHWTADFDRHVDDIFFIQDEISRALVSRLGLRSDVAAGQFATNLDTYEIYLQAHTLVDRRGVQNALRAAELFERAIARDPGFAPGHAGLATAHAFMSFPYRGVEFDAAYPTMRRAAVKALQLDPRLAEAHAAMGWVYAYEHDWPRAERSFQEAIRLDPSLTQAYTSYSISTLQTLEKWDDALRLLSIAARKDPLSMDVQREIGEVQLFSGRYGEAVDTLRRVTELEPDFPFVYTYLARALMLSGKIDEAAPLLEPGMPYMAKGLVMMGKRAEAERLADEWERYPFRVAIIAAILSDTNRAAAAVERVAENEPHRIGRLLIEPELAALRDHPRIAAVRKKFRLP
jgi:tetratricopeptide (TPR) repeat protein